MVVRSYAVLRQMLEDERARLEHMLDHGGSRADDGMGYGNHIADDATETFEQARDLSVRNRLQGMLQDVESALHRFGESAYGVCESCSERIDWARLEAKPEARLCIECQRRSDFGR